MKKLLFIFLLPFFATATTRYVKVAGGTGAGTDDASAWSYAKFNSMTLVAGDSVLFKRGDVFYGSLTVSTTGTIGSKIVYSCYGTGAKPLISGFTTLSGWSSVGGGVYQSACPSCKANDNMVIRDGVEQVIGRYPNSGYLPYQSATGTSITSSSLTGTPSYSGGQVAIRTNEYTTDRCNITSQSSGTLNYTAVSGYTGVAGFGFFIEKDSLTLDSLGEWFLSPSLNMKMYFGGNTPGSYVIKTSTVDTLVYVSTKNYLTFDNIDFEGGNMYAFKIGDADHVTVQHCSINFSGTDGVFYGGAVTNLNISYDTINHSNSDGIYSSPFLCANNYIGYNLIKNSGVIPGMALFDGQVGIQYITNRSVVEYNEVDSSGYVGVYYYGDSLNIRSNTINYFCFLKQDGGGIYSFAGSDSAIYVPSIVANNTIMNGIGATDGGIPINIVETRGSYEADGIYLDLNSSQVTISGNNISNCNASGIYLNQTHAITVTGNTLTNNNNGFLDVGPPTYGITFSNNAVIKKRNANTFGIYYFQGTPYTLPVTSNNRYVGGFDIDSSFKIFTTSLVKKTWQNWITNNATSDGNSVLTTYLRSYGIRRIKIN